MNIRDIAISRLHEYENNPRNNDLAVEKVRYSIERFGFLFPVIIDLNYVIVCGHTRVRACRELGIQTIPCIIADELTEEQINLFRLVDNKTSEYSDWDFEKLKEELSMVDLTLEKNQLLLDRFELSAEAFDLDPEMAEIRIPTNNFMRPNDKPIPKKPTVSTVHSGDNNNTNQSETTPSAQMQAISDDYKESTESEEPVSVTSDFMEKQSATETNNYSEVVANAEATSVQVKAAEDENIGTEKAKEQTGSMPFCQFRFGDVAFFISHIELDRLNKKYVEYLDSGDALKESFASYLLKGVEPGD